ncbi:hypothetical protein ACHAWO_001657 [Cyclotella atomus]|uniref:Uncharacterized protein n=1 Tax=Cyclotella atomus TaxID=382360 RepID=A0ABD3Q099_9STRA
MHSYGSFSIGTNVSHFLLDVGQLENEVGMVWVFGRQFGVVLETVATPASTTFTNSASLHPSLASFSTASIKYGFFSKARLYSSTASSCLDILQYKSPSSMCISILAKQFGLDPTSSLGKLLDKKVAAAS